MILAIDTGNTHTVIGCISSEGEILQIMRIETNPHKTEHEYAAGMKLILEMGGIDLKNVEGAVISSVVPPLTHVLRRAVKYITGIDALVVGAGIRTGLPIMLDETLLQYQGNDLVMDLSSLLAYEYLFSKVVDH